MLLLYSKLLHNFIYWISSVWLFSLNTNSSDTPSYVSSSPTEINIRTIPGFEWIFTDHDHKQLVCMYPRNSGKTTSALDWLMSRLIPHQKENASGLILSIDLAKVKEALRRSLLQYKPLIDAGFIKFNESTGAIQIKPRPNASIIESKMIKIGSYEQGENITGERPNYLVLDEARFITNELYNKTIHPLVDQFHDGQILIISTPEGMDNVFYKRFEQGQDPNNKFVKSVKKTVYDLGFTDEMIEYHKAMMDEKSFRQEMLCDASIDVSFGNIYKDILDQLEKLGYISDNIIYNPKYPVNIAFDLGYNDATAVVFWQSYNDRNFIIDYMELTKSFFMETIKKVKAKGYFDIKYCILPHDSTNNNVAGNGTTVYDMAVAEGWNVVRLPRAKSVLSEIEPCRTFLRTCQFNKTKCHLLLKHLSRYSFEIKTSRDPAHLGEKYCGKKPEEIGDHLHGCDAFRYVAMSNTSWCINRNNITNANAGIISHFSVSC